MTDAAATPPDTTATPNETPTATPTATTETPTATITVQSIEDKLAAGAPIEAADVRWLLDALRTATAGADAEPDVLRRPTREELIAEFRLGPDPSADMLAYLADYVVEREAEAAAEAAEAADES